MFFFNPRIISSSGGSYGNNADLNVAELKAIMKNFIIHDRPQKTQAAVWATDLDKSIRKVDVSAQTTGGGRIWAYQPKKRALRAPGGALPRAKKRTILLKLLPSK
ncbi:unnamed protein product [Phytophthora lilii]|uniref:Unnamed protein product n=1 Tax=Phytophthora lilii TaxID=2077276 RepID=A0A9W6XC48_9STRA|nr:unnamed protein product [Phytophthora lilii]